MAGSSAPDDMEVELELLSNVEYGSPPGNEAQPESCQKRQRLAFSRYHEENPPQVPPAVPVQPPAPDRPFKRKVAEYNTWFQQDAAAQSAAMRGKIVCDLDCANYTLSSNHKLMIAMLLDGENGALTRSKSFTMMMEPGLCGQSWSSKLRNTC